MNFCESCNIACGEERCPKCGKSKLRLVTEEDFCLVGRVDRIFGENLKENLQKQDIQFVLMPCGSGVRSKFALLLEAYLLYVRYKNLEYVRQILKEAGF